MLTKALSLLLVIFLGLAFGLETARFVHAHIAGGVAGVSGMVNIHRALLGFSLLATSGALLLSLRGAVVGVWLKRSANPFVELPAIALPPPGTPDCEACAQDAFDDAAKTTCTGCGDRGHWWPDCPSARPPPSREGRQPDGSYVIEVGVNETHEDVVRRHPEFIHGDFLFKQMGVAIDCAQEEAIRDYECQARKVGGLAHKRRTK